jgi:amidase
VGRVPVSVSVLVDTVGAFIVGPAVLAVGAADGALAGLTFAVKDLFDVEGQPTGAGNPDWLADFGSAASATAPAVQRLIDAGATLVGKTHTDELAYSIAGTNGHYGTPVNVNAPGRIPGGSSSGSAAAVAAGLVDAALGTDTGGSVRVPASYCGIFGLRPSWGRVPAAGVIPLSPSFDTVGVFARHPRLLRDMATALFGGDVRTSAPVEALVVAPDVWTLADADASSALRRALDGFDLPLVEEDLLDADDSFDQWMAAFRTMQSYEAWGSHGAWITSRRPTFAPDVAERFEAASRVTPAEVDAARVVRRRAAERLRSLLGDRRVLAIPSTCGPAPTAAGAGAVRARTLRLTCIAGHAGAPVVSVPLAAVDGLPLGLSLVGTPGQDEQVLDLAVALAEAVHP